MVKAGGHGVKGPEGLHPDVVAHRIVSRAADEHGHTTFQREMHSDDIVIISGGVIRMVTHRAGGVDARNLGVAQPSRQVEVVHEHVAECPPAAGDVIRTPRRHVMRGESHRVEHAEPT